jgi:hypothetical protein
MNYVRRIIAVGLPTAGLTVCTALALGGSPAVAGAADQVARPAAVSTPCAEADRGKCGYGATAPTDTPATGAGTVPTRGNGGYGTPGASVTPTPLVPASPTPTGNTASVPPGVSPSSAAPGTPMTAAATPSGGVSAGGALPVTGAPMGVLVSLGGLMVAAGAASVWYTRRRRTA